MFSTTGDEKRMQELEAKVLGALDLYFETRRREVEENKKNVGAEFEAYEGVRRKLAEAEEELVELRRRAAELQIEAVDAIVGGGEVSDLAEGGLRAAARDPKFGRG